MGRRSLRVDVAMSRGGCRSPMRLALLLSPTQTCRRLVRQATPRRHDRALSSPSPHPRIIDARSARSAPICPSHGSVSALLHVVCHMVCCMPRDLGRSAIARMTAHRYPRLVVTGGMLSCVAWHPVRRAVRSTCATSRAPCLARRSPPFGRSQLDLTFTCTTPADVSLEYIFASVVRPPCHRRRPSPSAASPPSAPSVGPLRRTSPSAFSVAHRRAVGRAVMRVPRRCRLGPRRARSSRRLAGRTLRTRSRST
jgi:hypothetical protein